ncbi:hypothetical protein Taro_048407 [Colocasia esculenta]|uniref:RAB6-interacting golgin n=1 Tax=Colocasia esculenta TaxID=4460 RepID=A0A843WVR4_COLES|nr:hypothetical protein [Colocasia esculenta]
MEQSPTTQKQLMMITWEERQQQQHQLQPNAQRVIKNSSSSDMISYYGSADSWLAASRDDDMVEEEGTPRSALSIFRANEEEIERRKMEVREKVFAQLGRAEQESKRLAEIRQEVEVMADPTRKEVAVVRRRIDAINRELRPLGQSCVKKEKEYKEAVEAFNEKNKEKAQLVSKLVELISESERLRMKKLEDLNKMIDTLR